VPACRPAADERFLAPRNVVGGGWRGAVTSPQVRKGRPLLWLGGFTVLVLAVIAVLVAVETRGVLSERGEHRGEVVVTGCTYLSPLRHGSRYRCEGAFIGDSGDIRVPSVTFTNDGRLDPGSRVAATVSGSADPTAHLVSESRWRLVVTGTGAVGLSVLLVCLWWKIPWRRRPA
jgi:hypothetical protein